MSLNSERTVVEARFLLSPAERSDINHPRTTITLNRRLRELAGLGLLDSAKRHALIFQAQLGTVIYADVHV